MLTAMRYCLLLLLFISIPAAATKLYETIDKDGNIVYTDTPPPNASAEELKLHSINITPAIKPLSLELKQDEPKKTVYTLLEVTSPEHDSTVFINVNNLSISVNSIPAVNTGENHSLQIMLDGDIISEGARTSLLLDNVNRGAHTVSARIIDGKGNILKSSKAVTVYIRKPSAIKPN